MTNINNPNPPINPSEDGWKRVQAIEGYRQKTRQYPPQWEPPKPHLFALFVTFFELFFSKTTKKGKELPQTQEIAHNLMAFLETLRLLAHEDKSHDPAFTGRLSTRWHTIDHDCALLVEALGPKDPLSQKFILLLEEIHHFPPWEEHSLGYYLSKRAGETWIPIPFMEILLGLHLSAQRNPFQNPIETWATMINDLIDTL